MVDSDRNEGKDYFEINRETGEIFTKVMFDREKQGAYALEVEARDGAPSARPNGNGQPNSGRWYRKFYLKTVCTRARARTYTARIAAMHAYCKIQVNNRSQRQYIYI